MYCAPQTVKKPRVALKARKSFNATSKIGDMCGDFRAILLAK